MCGCTGSPARWRSRHLFLLGLGGVVTTKGVGMAVPDWPTTYGDHMFFFPYSKWMAGIFDEHSHRLWASLVGMLAAAFAIWVWVRDSAGRQRWVGVAAMIAGLGLMGVRTPAVFVIVACACVGVIAYAIPRAIRDPKRLRWLGSNCLRRRHHSRRPRRTARAARYTRLGH